MFENGEPTALSLDDMIKKENFKKLVAERQFLEAQTATILRLNILLDKLAPLVDLGLAVMKNEAEKDLKS